VVKKRRSFGNHRYIRFWQKMLALEKIGEKEVQHQARKYGETKFGMERFINGFPRFNYHLVLSRFGKDPCIYLALWDHLCLSLV
jgi:hypothetical protein